MSGEGEGIPPPQLADESAVSDFVSALDQFPGTAASGADQPDEPAVEGATAPPEVQVSLPLPAPDVDPMAPRSPALSVTDSLASSGDLFIASPRGGEAGSPGPLGPLDLPTDEEGLSNVASSLLSSEVALGASVGSPPRLAVDLPPPEELTLGAEMDMDVRPKVRSLELELDSLTTEDAPMDTGGAETARQLSPSVSWADQVEQEHPLRHPVVRLSAGEREIAEAALAVQGPPPPSIDPQPDPQQDQLQEPDESHHIWGPTILPRQPKLDKSD